MTAPIVLTAHQGDAVQFLADHLHDGDPIVALRGLAGTGKTSLIPALIAVLESTGIPVTLGAPTHRAAMVLKKKGLEQADTVHAHALTPYFTGAYTKALRWLGGSCQCRIEDLANAQPAVDGVPWLVAERIKITGHTPEVVKARARSHEPKKALESIGITGRKHFAGFGAKEGSGVLIIDEASMVGEKMLALCQEAFPQICLVGDPGQLPPVQDTAQLADVPGYDLTELHRQAADSRIVQLAYAARYGEKFWESIPYVAGEVEEYMGVEASAFLHSPLVVWRNKTRLACTAAIRAALGYPKDAPQVGEPLVCRSTDPRARADGLYNNALFRVVPPSVVAMQQGNPRFVTIQPDGNPDAETIDVLVHMEETDGDNIDPEAILFRFGYCLTAHTAQGGEWPTVYISKPDLFAHSKRSPLNLSTQTQAFWMEILGTKALSQFLTHRPEPHATPSHRPQSMGWSWCCSLHACNILRARLPGTTAYVTCQRAASPVFVDRRYRNRVGLGRPYWIKCTWYFVTYANEMQQSCMRNCARWRNIRFTTSQPLRSSLAGALRTRLVDGEEDDFQRWAYTAITRAKQTLGFLRKHDFSATTPVAPVPWVLPHVGDDMPRMKQEPPIAPPSAPMLSRDPHEPDDILDPAVPLGLADEAMDAAIPGLPIGATTTVREPSNGVTPTVVPATVPPLPDAFLPLAHGFCQYLQGAFGAKLEETAIGMTKEVSATIDGMTRYAQGVLQSNEHVGYQLSDALLKVQEHGLTIHGSPYEMTLQVYTPAGVPLTLTIRKTSASDLLDELTRLETWLAMQGYSGDKPAQVEA